MSKSRSTALPDVPTIDEAGYPGLEGEGWVGILAPAGTPQPIIAQFSEQTRAVLASPDVAQRLATLGFASVGSTADEFAKQLAKENQTWATVITAANLKKL
jgi:tripartite-type tricarboxylate transporter receptor subunit TctC